MDSKIHRDLESVQESVGSVGISTRLNGGLCLSFWTLTLYRYQATCCTKPCQKTSRVKCQNSISEESGNNIIRLHATFQKCCQNRCHLQRWNSWQRNPSDYMPNDIDMHMNQNVRQDHVTKHVSWLARKLILYTCQRTCLCVCASGCCWFFWICVWTCVSG